MSTELQKSLAVRIKEFLQLDGEHSLFELAGLLREFRNNTHPDRFQDHDLKEKAEVRVKDAHALLDEIDRQLEIEHFNRKPTELALYKPLYDAVQLQNKLDAIEKELEDVKFELASERERSDELTRELRRKKDESLDAEIEHLQSIYRPSTRKYASIGLAILLSGALGVMSQMEKVSGTLEKYAPFGRQYVSTGLFVCLILFLASMLRKMWEREYIKRKSEEVCSPKCAGDFIEYLKVMKSSDTPISEFSEIDVFDFIEGKRRRLKGLVSFLGFQIFRRETVNRLKDIFIHNLLNKKLVDLSTAELMQRHFIISNTRTGDYWYRRYLTERDKNERTSPDASAD